MAEAGPSNTKPAIQTHREIPSFGLEYYEYRRHLFLAGLPLPVANTSDSTITIPLTHPAPLPPKACSSERSTAVKRLEALFTEDGTGEGDSQLWGQVLRKVKRNLDDGKKLVRALRLGLVIKILKAGWIQDGTWPVDPKTSKPVRIPPSPPSKPRAII